MKYFTALAALAGLAAAAPAQFDSLEARHGLQVARPAPRSIEARQTTANDLSGGCKAIFLIFARASTEIGNMGESMGPTVCAGLKRRFPNQVGCQGISSPAYSAGLADNIRPSGTSSSATNEAKQVFQEAVSKCPSAKIVFGGYSQGTAVMSTAISGLSSSVKNKLLGGVLFGYTKNKQNHGGIPNYPAGNVKVFCASNDGVCGGSLLVTLGHFSYISNGDGPQAISFLVSKINGAGSSTSVAAMTGMGGMAYTDTSADDLWSEEEDSSDSEAATATSTSMAGMGGMGGMSDPTPSPSPAAVDEDAAVTPTPSPAAAGGMSGMDGMGGGGS